jgi:hypothetical protein
MARKGALPVKVKQSICADRVAGLRVQEIAEKHRLHRVTVSRVLSRFRRESPDSILADPEGNYRERLKGKSIKALDAALDCDQDNYKRGGIAIQVMKGIGEFQAEQPTQGVVVYLQVPEAWRDRYERAGRDATDTTPTQVEDAKDEDVRLIKPQNE